MHLNKVWLIHYIVIVYSVVLFSSGTYHLFFLYLDPPENIDSYFIKVSIKKS